MDNLTNCDVICHVVRHYIGIKVILKHVKLPQSKPRGREQQGQEEMNRKNRKRMQAYSRNDCTKIRIMPITAKPGRVYRIQFVFIGPLL